jgi:hypothetical protein
MGAVSSHADGVGDAEPPFSASGLSFANSWEGTASGIAYGVWAGVARSDPDQGLLTVCTFDASGIANPDVTEVHSLGKDGALKVRSAHGTLLALTAADGAQLKFDLRTRTFVK